MTYARVIPRDLFNEANLLKCYGRLWIVLDNAKRGHGAKLGDGDTHGAQDDHDGKPFRIEQNEGTGAIFIANVRFTIHGKAYHLERPLNSREDWPLYCVDPETEDETEVFDAAGSMSEAFRALVYGEAA